MAGITDQPLIEIHLDGDSRPEQPPVRVLPSATVADLEAAIKEGDPTITGPVFLSYMRWDHEVLVISACGSYTMVPLTLYARGPKLGQ
jgi:hypothetical protein